jgi:hypothetical protein
MLLAAPGLPKVLWEEAIAISIYLTNRSPTKTLPKGKKHHTKCYTALCLVISILRPSNAQRTRLNRMLKTKANWHHDPKNNGY